MEDTMTIPQEHQPNISHHMVVHVHYKLYHKNGQGSGIFSIISSEDHSH